jgi:hypothetical protein
MPVTTICPACSREFSVSKTRLSQEPQPCCSIKCRAKIRVGRLKHGHCRKGEWSKEFRAWYNMRVRCYFVASKSYERYGGRGITVCERWMSFESFLEDVGLAPSPAHTLGRIDNEGNYEPGNVEWQLWKPQCNNRSTNHFVTAFGRTQTVQQWADEKHIGSSVILARLDRCGWTPEDAVSRPSRFTCTGEERLLTFQGKTMNIAAWSRETGIKAGTIQRRVAGGWSDEKTLTASPLTYHNRS